MPYELDGDVVYDVKRIMDHCYVRNGRGPVKLQYLVKWEGYGPEHDSWEPQVNWRDDLSLCPIPQYTCGSPDER